MSETLTTLLPVETPFTRCSACGGPALVVCVTVGPFLGARCSACGRGFLFLVPRRAADPGAADDNE